jgi:hypothetical protein
MSKRSKMAAACRAEMTPLSHTLSLSLSLSLSLGLSLALSFSKWGEYHVQEANDGSGLQGGKEH